MYKNAVHFTEYTILPHYDAAGALDFFVVESTKHIASDVPLASASFSLEDIYPALSEKAAARGITKAWTGGVYNGSGQRGIATDLLKVGDQFIANNSNNRWRQFYNAANQGWNGYRGCFSSRDEVFDPRIKDGHPTHFLGEIP